MWHIYTDGASRGNPGPSSWAFVVLENDHLYKGSKSGFLGNSTNNVAELTAILEALKFAERLSGEVVIYADSSYALNSITQWMNGWAAKGWKKSDGKPVQNLRLMQDLYEQKNLLGSRIRYVKVSGHSGVYGNEKADQVCNQVLDIEESKNTINNWSN